MKERGSLIQFPEQPTDGQGRGDPCKVMGNRDPDPDWYLRLLTPETRKRLEESRNSKVK